MTKSELIKCLITKLDHLTQEEVTRLVDIIFSQISTALTQGRRVELRGFGAFSVRERSPRKARNPKNNESVTLSTRYTPYFRAGKGLRERINNTAV